MVPDIATLTHLIDDEVIRALNIRTDSWLADRIHSIIRPATRRFSEIFAEVDAVVEQEGLPGGARLLLRKLGADFQARGVGNIPTAGPVIIASNHPGTVDSVALAASSQRRDLKIIAGPIQFLQNCPNISRHVIYTADDNMQRRMVTVRECIRHLREGGALLTFAHGTIDPDPDFMPTASQELHGWSRSLEIFLNRVPEARVVVSIVSGVVDQRYMRNPLTLARHNRVDRQRIAEMLQIILQMLGRKMKINPRVSFAESLDMQHIGDPDCAMDLISQGAQQLLQSHMAWQTSTPISGSLSTSMR
ncbi:MAG TPA: 1-acyl-sn-glycerol-3-phosphate acyltransferase [Anaerolineales bacterium]|nr:1-acyl-sn-glycerol-3-phosphate acyltransferase [Anaerolineales bacterium]